MVVVCASALIVNVDNTILNVALPTRPEAGRYLK